MSDTPERIWISEADEGGPATWTPVKVDFWPEYIHADLHDAEIARRKEQNAALSEIANENAASAAEWMALAESRRALLDEAVCPKRRLHPLQADRSEGCEWCDKVRAIAAPAPPRDDQ